MSQVFRRYSIFITIYVDTIWAMVCCFICSLQCLPGGKPSLQTHSTQKATYHLYNHNISQQHHTCNFDCNEHLKPPMPLTDTMNTKCLQHVSLKDCGIVKCEP